MPAQIETVQTTNRPVQIRVFRSSLEGERGWFWCWSEVGTEWADRGNWSDATGPLPTRKEAREYAIEIVSTF